MGFRHWSPVQRLGVWVAIALVLLLVWPTRWRLIATDDRVYRVDRLTGCFQYATDSGWSRPWQRTC